MDKIQPINSNNPIGNLGLPTSRKKNNSLDTKHREKICSYEKHPAKSDNISNSVTVKVKGELSESFEKFTGILKNSGLLEPKNEQVKITLSQSPERKMMTFAEALTEIRDNKLKDLHVLIQDNRKQQLEARQISASELSNMNPDQVMDQIKENLTKHLPKENKEHIEIILVSPKTFTPILNQKQEALMPIHQYKMIKNEKIDINISLMIKNNIKNKNVVIASEKEIEQLLHTIKKFIVELKKVESDDKKQKTLHQKPVENNIKLETKKSNQSQVRYDKDKLLKKVKLDMTLEAANKNKQTEERHKEEALEKKKEIEREAYKTKQEKVDTDIQEKNKPKN